MVKQKSGHVQTQQNIQSAKQFKKRQKWDLRFSQQC